MAKKKDVLEVPEITAENMPAIITEEGIKPFIDEALAKAELLKKEVADVNTDSGRKAIRKAGKEVSSSKTALEKPAAEYVRKIKAEGVAVAAILSGFKTQMDSIRDDVLQPLKVWEAGEAERVKGLQDEIERLSSICKAAANHAALPPLDQLTTMLSELKAGGYDPEVYGDLHEEVCAVWCEAITAVESALSIKTAMEAQAAENAKLQQQLADQKKQAEIAQAAADAAAAATQKAANDIAAAQARAEQAEAQQQQAVERARKEEQAKAEQKAADDQRLMQEAEEQAAALSANQDHQRAVNNAVMNSLMVAVPALPSDAAKAVVKAIIRGNVQHVQVNY